jgi:hypothetical protein
MVWFALKAQGRLYLYVYHVVQRSTLFRPPPLTTRRIRDAFRHDEIPEAEAEMEQDTHERNEGVSHPGTKPPEQEGRGVVTREARHRHQREVLPRHQQGAQSTLEGIAMIGPRVADGRHCDC